MAVLNTCKMYLGDALVSGGGVYEYDQTLALVKIFLANVTYDSSDYTTSEIANYAPSTADVNNTYPSGVDINGATYYNHIPNKYSAILLDNNQSAVVKPTHFLRQIKCATANVRDLGGWACDGGTVKYGKLFRGGEIAEADIDIFVNQLGIRQELNLRGVAEAGSKTVSILGSEIGYVCTKDILWYSLTNTTDWKTTLRCVFDAIADNKPVFFHCSAGADRTGTVACILEAILGVSQSDMDKDYELTTFMYGSGTDANARRRNETDWQGLINQINALTIGTTFRDKVLNWVASLGFTADEINAFRNAMIDGTPSAVTLDIDTFSITKNGENVTFDNDASGIAEYQPYTVNIVPKEGYLIKSATVTMGGLDITKEVFDGAFQANGTLNVIENGEYNVSEYKKVNVDVDVGVVTQHTVSKTLSNSESNNSQTNVISEQSFGAVITPKDGHSISNITVKMGGTDITSSVLTLIEEV